MRAIPFLSGLMLVTSLMACDSSEPGEMSDGPGSSTGAQSDSSPPCEKDTGIDDSSTADGADGTNCQDPRKLGDGKAPSDFCWDPPENYCSVGGGDGVQKACSPDFSVCCMFVSQCIPCGWVECSCGGGDGSHCQPDVPPGCHAKPTPLSDPACLAPDFELVICMDE